MSLVSIHSLQLSLVAARIQTEAQRVTLQGTKLIFKAQSD